MGMVAKVEAISDIEAGRASYAVAGGQTLEVVDGPTGKYLRSHADGDNADNLDQLPNPEADDPAWRAAAVCLQRSCPARCSWSPSSSTQRRLQIGMGREAWRT